MKKYCKVTETFIVITVDFFSHNYHSVEFIIYFINMVNDLITTPYKMYT